jgi:hypothetical protein
MDILKRKGGRFSIRFSVRFSFFSPLQCTVQYKEFEEICKRLRDTRERCNVVGKELFQR